jgi:hypothetical protein
MIHSQENLSALWRSGYSLGPNGKSMKNRAFSLRFLNLVILSSTVVLILSFSALLANNSGYATSGAPGSISDIDVSATLLEGDAISIHVTNSANISAVTVAGGQYIESSQTLANNTDLSISPTNVSTYDVQMFIVGQNKTYSIDVWKVSSTTTLLAGYSEQSNTVVDMRVDFQVVAPVPKSSSLGLGSGWNLLFGLTGIKLGPVAITFDEALQALTVLSAALLFMGIYLKKTKVAYSGIVILGIILFATLGILILLVAVLSYLVGFGVLNIAWRLKKGRIRRTPPR